MGQKVNPYALRLIINKEWKSSYFVRGRKQAEVLRQDNLIRKIISLSSKEVLHTKIERSNLETLIFITTSNLSHFTDKNNKKLDELIYKIKSIINNNSMKVKVNLIELKNLFSDAQYVANFIASRIESRSPFRVASRMALSKALPQREVKGIRVKLSGRLDGSEIAKTEKINHGKVPLSTLTSIIDYAQAEAKATYGKIGISVWIYKGKFGKKNTLSSPWKKNYRDKDLNKNVNT